MEKTKLYAYIVFEGNDDFPLEVVTSRPEFSPFSAAIHAGLDIDMYVFPPFSEPEE